MADTRIFLSAQPLMPAATTSGAAKKTSDNGQSFAAVLDAARQVTFSKHAMNRLKERNIDLSTDTLNKLGDTVDRMAKKGARESLIYLNDIAMVVSVANRKVITAMDGEGLNDNIFTNIDSAAILR